MTRYLTARSLLDSPFRALRYWQHHIPLAPWFDRDREIAIVVCLNTKFFATGFALVSIGTLTECLVHPRDVYRPALALNSYGIMFMHNHPSGDPKPSAPDRALTEQLNRAGDILMVRLLDHIIVGSQNRYFSFTSGC